MPESVLNLPKLSAINDNKSVRKFRNLSQCLRNTQALTTENVRLFKTVQVAL